YLPIKGKEILIVDDVVDTGNTLHEVIKYISTRYRPSTIKTSVLHVKPTSKYLPDYYSVKLNKWLWIIYPWTLYETLFSILYKEYGCNIKAMASDKLLYLFYKKTMIKIEDTYGDLLNTLRRTYENALCKDDKEYT
ncbi:MAG: hypothetical protein J7K21_02875, partial [Desulfurococcales archaeon]|nr:hypothetical protein [Desulfurococcales archaeon]